MPYELKFTLFGEEGMLKFRFKKYAKKPLSTKGGVRVVYARNKSGASVKMVDQLEDRNEELRKRAKFYDDYASKIAHRGPIKGLKVRP